MELTTLIKHPERLDKETLYDLRSLLALHPYYQPARLLMLKNLYLLHDESFDEELRRAAIYLTDRRKIFDLVEAAHYQLAPASKEKKDHQAEADAPQSADRTITLIDHFLDSIPKDEEEEKKFNMYRNVASYIKEYEDAENAGYIMDNKNSTTALSLPSGGLATCANGFQAIVYNDFSGAPLKVTNLDGRWWVTTPGERLQPLENYFEGEDIDFIYLTEAGGKVGALALAKMLGKALEEPEDEVEQVLRNRVRDLKRMGVELNVKDEPLVLELKSWIDEQYAGGRQTSLSVEELEEKIEKLSGGRLRRL